ncbi:radical SAM protein [Desulfobacula sp.]|uniref:radical SAM/SPASM domain-containing protein n=1 Tax=Desulfobacula sp. TaxID=2593537 RepID=UPI00262E0CCF|nr:radical SAM protein [Desulfobacula sp.]
MDKAITATLDAITRAGLKPPKRVTLMVTNGCNLCCCHCWPESRSNKTTPPVPADSIMRVIRDFVVLGAEEICLTGGEPLTHPDWFDILSFACNQTGLDHVRLQTNGTLLTEVEIAALGSINFKGLTVQVSLDGATPETHDRVRGSGSFVQAFRGLKLLADTGMGKQVVVAFTETQHNFADLPPLFQLLDELGIGQLVSGTLVMGGRASHTDQLAPPTPSQYRELITRYHSDSLFKSRYKKMGNIAAIEWFTGKAFPGADGCRCLETPYITADGNMYPCLMLPMDQLAARDVFHRPLAEVLFQGLARWAELPELNHRRSVELEACKACPNRLHCAGGCMGRAFTAVGDFMAVEDRCALRQAVYSWKPHQTGK